MLHRPPSTAVSIPHGQGDLDLQFKSQLVHRAIGNQMEVTAHRPEKILRRLKCCEFLGAEHTCVNQLLGMKYTVDIFFDPIQGLQIAQPTFAFFDIWLHHIALAALLEMARLTFRKLGFGKLACGIFKELFTQLGLKLLKHLLIAKQRAHLNQRCANGIIFARKAQAITDRAAGMADFEAEIPQHIKQGFDHAFGPSGHLIGNNKEQIYI